jgi:hypothetical protein
MSVNWSELAFSAETGYGYRLDVWGFIPDGANIYHIFAFFSHAQASLGVTWHPI